MENLIKIDTVDQYNKMFGLETLHPLVSVVDLSKSETWPTNFRVNYGIYGFPALPLFVVMTITPLAAFDP